MSFSNEKIYVSHFIGIFFRSNSFFQREKKVEGGRETGTGRLQNKVLGTRKGEEGGKSETAKSKYPRRQRAKRANT